MGSIDGFLHSAWELPLTGAAIGTLIALLAAPRPAGAPRPWFSAALLALAGWVITYAALLPLGIVVFMLTLGGDIRNILQPLVNGASMLTAALVTLLFVRKLARRVPRWIAAAGWLFFCGAQLLAANDNLHDRWDALWEHGVCVERAPPSFELPNPTRGLAVDGMAAVRMLANADAFTSRDAQKWIRLEYGDLAAIVRALEATGQPWIEVPHIREPSPSAGDSFARLTRSANPPAFLRFSLRPRREGEVCANDFARDVTAPARASHVHSRWCVQWEAEDRPAAHLQLAAESLRPGWTASWRSDDGHEISHVARGSDDLSCEDRAALKAFIHPAIIATPSSGM